LCLSKLAHAHSVAIVVDDSKGGDGERRAPFSMVLARKSQNPVLQSVARVPWHGPAKSPDDVGAGSILKQPDTRQRSQAARAPR